MKNMLYRLRLRGDDFKVLSFWQNSSSTWNSTWNQLVVGQSQRSDQTLQVESRWNNCLCDSSSFRGSICPYSTGHVTIRVFQLERHRVSERRKFDRSHICLDDTLHWSNRKGTHTSIFKLKTDSSWKTIQVEKWFKLKSWDSLTIGNHVSKTREDTSGRIRETSSWIPNS